MAKSIKFKNDNYLDSTSIVHNKTKLSDVLSKAITSEVIWTGTCKYGNTCCSIDRTKYFKIEAYLTHGVKGGTLNSPYNNDIVVTIDCSGGLSHMAGGFFFQ